MAKPGKKHRLRRTVITLLVLAVIAAGTYFIGLPMLMASVTTAYDEYTASVGTISNSLSFSAAFQLKNSKTLTAGAETTVRSIFVKEGQKVSAGDRLMRLADGELLKAEFDGTINVINVSEGDSVNMQTQLMQYADFEHMRVSIRVDEYDISEVSVGMPCIVTATAQERDFNAVIRQIDYVSQSTGNVAYYTATADVEVDGGVYPGMQATVTIPQEEAKDVVVLKMDALSFDRKNSAFVYTMNEAGEMEATPVTLGVNNGNYVEIVSGISEGDTVYVESGSETEATGGIFSILNSLNRTQINQNNRGDRGSWNGSSGSNYRGTSGNMPSGGNFGGGAPGMPGGN